MDIVYDMLSFLSPVPEKYNISPIKQLFSVLYASHTPDVSSFSVKFIVLCNYKYAFGIIFPVPEGFL